MTTYHVSVSAQAMITIPVEANSPAEAVKLADVALDDLEARSIPLSKKVEGVECGEGGHFLQVIAKCEGCSSWILHDSDGPIEFGHDDEGTYTCKQCMENLS